MTAPPLFTLREGGAPLLISIPHAGTYLPPGIAARLTDTGRAVPDTDWHVDRLYDFAAGLDATVLAATHSRIVVDLNRPPDGARLYPGQAETGICPTETFSGLPYYADAPPGPGEIAGRIDRYWRPYHDALAAQLARLHALHGTAHLLDGHSIHGEIPRLFPGRLPDLNLGTNDGRSAGAGITARAIAALGGHGFTTVLNGRFKGGYITRHYGAPDAGIHALQLEMAWRSYTDEDAPRVFDPARAAPLAAILRALAAVLLRA